MKIFRLTEVYSKYTELFTLKYADVKLYSELLKYYYYDCFGWADSWGETLKKYEYQCMEIPYDLEVIQRAWARENSIKDYGILSLEDIVIEQLKDFKPTILWFDCTNWKLLDRILKEVTGIKLTMGWVGSALQSLSSYKLLDIILSCAPESVEILDNYGYKAYHLDHSFDPRVNNRLKDYDKKYVISFIGQILKASQYHISREGILSELCKVCDISIFSEIYTDSFINTTKRHIKNQLVFINKCLYKSGITNKTSFNVWGTKKVLNLDNYLDSLKINKQILRRVQPPVYGLEMYQTIKDSNICLNIHADSSPKYASNMRLFEITGVGTCMLTDCKSNINSLFEVDKEIVTFSCIEDCVEKIKWLNENPKKCREIAMAGQNKTLNNYTFDDRAKELNRIINENI